MNMGINIHEEFSTFVFYIPWQIHSILLPLWSTGHLPYSNTFKCFLTITAILCHWSGYPSFPNITMEAFESDTLSSFPPIPIVPQYNLPEIKISCHSPAQNTSVAPLNCNIKLKLLLQATKGLCPSPATSITFLPWLWTLGTLSYL